MLAVAVTLAGGLLGLAALRLRRARADARRRRRTVGEAMTTAVVSVPGSMPLREVERDVLAVHPYRVFPVLRGASVVGLLRRSDVLRQPARDRSRLTAQAVMLRLHPYLVARPGDDVRDAVPRLLNRAGCLIVVEDGRLCGLFTAHEAALPPAPATALRST